MREPREFLLPFIFGISYTIMNKYYTGEQVHIHIKSLINVTQYNNRVNVKGKSPLFCGNGKQVITIYGGTCPISFLIGWKIRW